jgi:hypothetical protein
MLMIAGGWAAILAMFYLPTYTLGFPTWATGTLIVAAVTGGVIVLVTIETVRAWRGGAARLGRVHMGGLVLGGTAWFCGGLLAFINYSVFLHSHYCGGEGFASFDCLHRPGPALEAFGVVSAVAATPALLALIIVGRRSRVAAWLSPVLIAGLYLLATCLWEPHVGWGVPFRTW